MLTCTLVILTAWSAGCRASTTDIQEAPMGITVTSTAFTPGKPIPVKYTGQGEDISPDLFWRDTPSGVVSFALVCDDPDAPAGTWVHWTMWNIPAASTGLAQDVPTNASLPDGSVQGVTSAGTSCASPVDAAGMFHMVQWTQVPAGASGSSQTRAKLTSPDGVSLQKRSGEMSSPCPVYLTGTGLPGVNAVLVTVIPIGAS